MPTINYSRTASGIGSIQSTSSKLKTPIGIAFEIPVPKGKLGSLTTRTSDWAGVITLAAGHGLVNGQYDIYWSDSRFLNSTVTISGNLATFAFDEDSDLDVNIVLPDQGSSMVISTPVTFDFPFPADQIQFMVAEAIMSSRIIGVQAAIWTKDVDDDHESRVAWNLQSGRIDERDFSISPPDSLIWSGNLAQQINTWFFSHGSSIQDCAIKLIFMCDPLNQSSS